MFKRVHTGAFGLKYVKSVCHRRRENLIHHLAFMDSAQRTFPTIRISETRNLNRVGSLSFFRNAEYQTQLRTRLLQLKTFILHMNEDPRRHSCGTLKKVQKASQNDNLVIDEFTLYIRCCINLGTQLTDNIC